jgi:hypothetical protein
MCCRQSPILTPPPDHEADIERDRSLEERARKELEGDGCPPCYPTGLGFPLKDTPDEGIISYWKSLPGTGRLILSAQLSDWKRFRSLQRKTFLAFQDKVRDRLRRNHPDPEQQSQLENWTEFQNYHLQKHMEFEKDVQDDKEKLAAARKKLEDIGAPGLELAEEVEIFEGRIKSGEIKLRQREVLLRWVEQQRVAMAAEQSTFGHADQSDGPKAIRKARGLDRPKRQPKHHSVLSPKRQQKPHSVLSPKQAGVSKSTSRKRSLRPQKRGGNVAQGAENATAAPRLNISRMPDVREHKPRRGKESTPLGPFRPQKVSKTARRGPKGKQAADANVKSQPKSSTDRARSKRRKSIHESAPVVVTTRSGRESKRPERFV